MLSDRSDQPEFKALGIVSEGEFERLLELAVNNHLYGTLELIANETTRLTFVDGFVVLEEGDIPNRALDRERMSSLLHELLAGDGFVGRYRFGVVAGRKGVHELPRFNPLTLAKATADATNSDKQAANAESATKPSSEGRVGETPPAQTPVGKAAPKPAFDRSNLGIEKPAHLLAPTVEVDRGPEEARPERRRSNDALFNSLSKMPERPRPTERTVAQTKPESAERRRNTDKEPPQDRGAPQPGKPAAKKPDEAVSDAESDRSDGKPNRRTALRRLIRTLSS